MFLVCLFCKLVHIVVSLRYLIIWQRPNKLTENPYNGRISWDVYNELRANLHSWRQVAADQSGCCWHANAVGGASLPNCNRSREHHIGRPTGVPLATTSVATDICQVRWLTYAVIGWLTKPRTAALLRLVIQDITQFFALHLNIDQDGSNWSAIFVGS